MKSIYKNLFLLFFTLIFTISAFGQQKGLDLIGLRGYSSATVKNIKDLLPANSTVGYLSDRTFGNSDVNIISLCNSGKVSDITVDLFNTTAVRNKVLQKEEYLYGYTISSLNKAACAQDKKLTNIIDAGLQRLQSLQNQCSSVRIHPSLWLEHDLDKACAEGILGYAKTRYTLVAGAHWIDSPMKNYPAIGGAWTEKHGNKPRLSNSISNDGTSVFDANFFGDSAYQKQGSDIVENWMHEFNKNKTGNKKFIAPLKRPSKYEPTKDQIKHAIYLLRDPQPAPTTKPQACKTARKLKEPELWKPAAEDYGDGDRRASKPLLISKSKRSSLDVLNLVGKKVGYLKYYGSYSGTKGYNRHYLGSGSGESSMSIMQKAGSEWGYVKDGSNCFIVNFPRRTGYYR